MFVAAIKAISDDRFGPYVRAGGGDDVKGLHLYHWNMRASAALYESLHIVEIALRNTIDREFSAWNKTQTDENTGQARSADWLLDPAPLLARIVRQDKIDEATERAVKHIRRRRVSNQAISTPAHCDVLAQMMFGTWRFALKAPTGRRPDSGSVLLWRDVFPKAFPAMTRQPIHLVNDVVRIYEARNRIAHLEPMLDSQQVSEIRNSVGRILADIGALLPAWFSSQETISGILTKHPTHPIS
ncbi:hypothetical protein DM794_06075 [Paenarthrobacter ureafaciens]|nr:hypothetical protein [Paenarthrobacter ureafaciens]